MRFAALALLLGIAASASAQDWALRQGDVPLTARELDAFAHGVTLTYRDEGTAKFSAGGSYSYTYGHGGGVSFGNFEVKKDGRVCINFRVGRDRCDLYVRRNGVVVMLSETGEHFPVRVHFGLKR